uniref:Cadherin domain-containing protein n=1 Tax=Acrobeloides nanus TaxID=290746 RepID=A0A914CPX4_9BILA
MVLDENDNNPMFMKTQYNVSIDDQTPINSKIVKLDAFDADEGINSELYFSLVNPSPYFYIDSRTGWIRTFAPLQDGNYTLDCFIEDRASRLFYQQRDTDSGSAYFRNKAQVFIHVQKHSNYLPKINIEYKPLKLYENGAQHAATISFDEIWDREIGLETLPNGISNNSTMAWSEKFSPKSFGLFLSGVWDSTIPIMVTVKDLLKEETLFVEKLEFDVKNSKRSLWFDDVEEGLTLFLNESVPAGYIVHRFRANTTYKQELGKIRYFIKNLFFTPPRVKKLDPCYTSRRERRDGP